MDEHSWPDAERPGVPEHATRTGLHVLVSRILPEAAPVVVRWMAEEEHWVFRDNVRGLARFLGATEVIEFFHYAGPYTAPADVARRDRALRHNHSQLVFTIERETRLAHIARDFGRGGRALKHEAKARRLQALANELADALGGERETQT